MTPKKLKFHRLDDHHAVVLLRGDHDSYSAEQVARRVRRFVDEGCDVEVDLREATFIDSTTVAALIDAHRYASENDRRLSVLIGESTGWAVQRLFELTRLDSLLTVLSDR